MSYLIIDIDKIIDKLKENAENDYIKQCNNPEKDDDGSYITPSLIRAIELVLDKYFAETYGEISEEINEEFDKIYTNLSERLLSELDEEKIKMLILEMKENYKGLSEYERNSGKY